MTGTSECECCGSKLDVRGDVKWNAAGWTLETSHGRVVIRGARQAQLFDLLWRKRGAQSLTRQRIIDILFADDIDGGPDVGLIGMMVKRLRAAIAPVGGEIIRGTTSGNGYRLAFTTPEQALARMNDGRAFVTPDAPCGKCGTSKRYGGQSRACVECRRRYLRGYFGRSGSVAPAKPQAEAPRPPNP